MTALDDHYTTLSNNKSEKESEIETKADGPKSKPKQ